MQDVLITDNEIPIIPPSLRSHLTPSYLQARLVTMAVSVEAERQRVFSLAALK